MTGCWGQGCSLHRPSPWCACCTSCSQHCLPNVGTTPANIPVPVPPPSACASALHSAAHCSMKSRMLCPSMTACCTANPSNAAPAPPPVLPPGGARLHSVKRLSCMSWSSTVDQSRDSASCRTLRSATTCGCITAGAVPPDAVQRCSTMSAALTGLVAVSSSTPCVLRSHATDTPVLPSDAGLLTALPARTGYHGSSLASALLTTRASRSFGKTNA
mmetsp:Transcript_32398/g.82269  ORF Transcript_32398/g.82269 Transcript_32398/m.82269 type:complete len:216 (+) Transcript_32398:405-1052(+)